MRRDSDFVRAHRLDDVHLLALQSGKYPDEDMPWVVCQVDGWQRARDKVPRWAATEGILYPPHLSMEQCSSEEAARYKGEVVRRLLTTMPQLCNNQMADMERSFAVQSALQNCCCENRASIADLKYTVATENCADRTQSMMNTRDIIDSQTRGTQQILDKLCALELDGVKGQLAQAQRENVGLQNQLNMANLAASQTAQTVNIRDSIIDELRSCPIPSQPVYGSTPIFTCGNNNGCGCGGNF